QDQSGNSTEMTPDIHRLAIAAVLANEGFLGHRNDTWVHHGDAVDVALLVMAHKLNLTQHELIEQYSELARIPYEPANQYAASLHQIDQRPVLFVKGAQEKILSLCNRMMTAEGETQLDLAAQQAYAQRLAEQGYRVISLAMGYPEEVGTVDSIKPDYLGNLIFLGSVGIIDPLREEAAAAITACHAAGIDVAMITGDHPVTAKVIADGLGLTNREEQVVTGRMLHQYQDDSELDQVTRYSHLYARVEPHQKLTIVQSLQRNGHFVAVTGDGVNDAPALRAAHVGVAMGKSGTDIARETADIIITDDNFNSIVAGIEEGRIAYANVRKVIFLLLSTGAGEIVLFLLSILSGLPIPLTAVQLLWLNLVTNGIQDVALAFEPGEGDELQHPPRSPQEPIFNRAMIERVCLSAVVMGVVAWLAFSWLLSLGYSTEQARNSVLLLMVLFENIHVFNSRSETRSVFRLNPLRNPILLIGTILAQLLHIGAMYMPGLNAILEVQPVSLSHWTILFALAISLLVVIEIYKILKQSKRRAKTAVTPRGPR
ncbi:MAG: HAD-IC family P-type ATPase, partial [Gammaproteobacteria bacterium]|nr:HAD-IC family P-type ATPase [Gammaproteobacteria bacterium]